MTISLDDQRAIEALLVRYATAVDQRDEALLAACFTQDVRADYGREIGQFGDRDALVGHLLAMLGACGPTLHYVSNFALAPEGDGVKSRCYTQAVVHLPGVDQPLRTAGTYDDRLCRTDGGWRIAERVYTPVA